MTEAIIPEKRCVFCQLIKPLTEFYFQPSRNRHDARCKCCDKAIRAARRSRRERLPPVRPLALRGCPLLVKTCTRCKTTKPRTEFYDDARGPWCKECQKQYQVAYYQTPTGNQKIRARSAARVLTDEQKDNQLQRAKEYLSTPRGKALRAATFARRQARLGADGRRNQQLQIRFGLTLDEYNVMRDEQNGCCAICGRPESEGVKGRLAVDHDHETNIIRELLCIQCNVGLGHFYDNPDLLANALCYLYTHQELAAQPMEVAA